jgi:hypothetical protein
MNFKKQSHNTPFKAQRGDEVWLLLINDLDTRWGSASRPGRALSSGKGTPVPIGQEAGWASEPVWTQSLDEKFSCLCRGSNLNRPVV